MTSIAERAAASSFLRGLEPSQMARVAALAREASFSAGEEIFREGEQARHLLIIESGRAALTVLIPGRGEMTLMTVEAGDLLGWSAFVPPHHKTASAKALTSVTALAIEGEALRALCDEDPALGYALCGRISQVLAKRLKATRVQLLDVFAAQGE